MARGQPGRRPPDAPGRGGGGDAEDGAGAATEAATEAQSLPNSERMKGHGLWKGKWSMSSTSDSSG